MLALTGAIPALVVMWIFDRMDAKRPEPRWSLRKVSIAGAFSTIPVIIVGVAIGYEGQGTYEAAAINGFLVAGLTEEIAKFLCVYAFIWRKPEFDERMDGITYAARAGLGFALVENVLYMAKAIEDGQFWLVFTLRALLAVPGHAIWAGIVGYFAARRRFDKRGPGIVGGLFLAVFMHGLYDFALFSAPALQADIGDVAIIPAFAIPIGLIVFGALWLRRMARAAVAADDLEAATRANQPVLVYNTE